MTLKQMQAKEAALLDGMDAMLKHTNDKGNLSAAQGLQFQKMRLECQNLQQAISEARTGRPGSVYPEDQLAALRGGERITNGLEEFRDTYRLRPGDRAQRMKVPEERAFSNYLRYGIENLDDDDRSLMGARFRDANALGIRNAQTTVPGSGGGYLVPQGFSKMLEEAMKWFGGIDGVVGEFQTETGNATPWPTVNDTTNMGRIIGQNVQVTETDLTFNQVTFNSYILSSDTVLIPRSLMDDAFFDMDALVAKLLGTRLGRLLNNKCTLGTGTNEPTGIVTAAVTAGLINQFQTGETGTLSYADLVNIEHAVDPAYRNANSRWMFHDNVLKLLKKLVDTTGRMLWQPGLTASFADGMAVIGSGRPTILGYPYVVNNDMAVPAASAYSLLFGDMSCFKLRKVGAPTVLRLVERYADYLQIGFIAFFRVDSNLIDAGTHPIVVAQQAAS